LRLSGIQHIRALIITHLHLDHYKSAGRFLSNCGTQLGIECEHVLLNGWNPPRSLPSDADKHESYSDDPKLRKNQRADSFRELQTWAMETINRGKCLPLIRLDQGNHLNIDGGIAQAITILQPDYAQSVFAQHNLNNTSAILRVEGINASALLTSDIEWHGWQELQRTYPNLKSDVLKFPHHGAWKDADPAEILDAVKPSIIVISVGTNGHKYDHPNQHVLDVIRERSETRLLCTQATNRCGANSGLATAPLIEQLNAASSEAAHCVRIKRGCPCAGTVVIELNHTADVLQPRIQVHRDQIINVFYDTPQCGV
jgi:competence protein ComEC